MFNSGDDGKPKAPAELVDSSGTWMWFAVPTRAMVPRKSRWPSRRGRRDEACCRARVLSLALALLAIVPSPAYSATNSSATSPSAASPAGGSPAGGPAPAKNEGCAGETYRVSMVSHAFNMTREHAPGNRSPTGFLRITNFDLTVRGTFVSELRDGKLKWVSRVVDWSGQSSDNVPECHSVSCDAADTSSSTPPTGVSVR